MLILMFISTLWINVDNTRTYINNQLESHAQDTATSLGLSIKPFIGNKKDLPMIEGMINVIFDSGYYQQVLLTTQQGEVILEKNNPIELDAVPNWFINLFALTPPQASTEIYDGWVKPKRLSIISHPGLGYQQLWHSAIKSTWMIFGLFIVAGSLIYLFLRTITVPIKKAAKQANEICQGNFVQVDKIPKPQELNLFVNAMNRMSKILQNMFNELTKQTETYRAFAYIDELTNTPNRRAFNNQFKSLMADQEQVGSGYLMIIRMSSLNEINQHGGYNKGDAYIQQAATIIKQHLTMEATTNLHQVYRISGSDFAMILQNIGRHECKKIIASLITPFVQASTTEHQNGYANIGVSAYSPCDQVTHILDQADSALSKAMTSHNNCQFADSLAVTKSNTEWQQQLTQLLKQPKVILAAQAIKDIDSSILYHELYGRFHSHESSRPIPMAQLIPVAEKLNLAYQLDQLVISNALVLVSQQKNTIALNISPSSIGNIQFCDWLINQLNNHKNICSKLVFELSEQCLINHANNTIDIANRLKKLGCQITIEHFGSSIYSFAHLMKIKPNYVKIDGSYCQQIEESIENQQFVKSLVNIAHSLQIGVIAELVETQAQASMLQSLFVDYLQGFHIDTPSTWP